MDTASTLIGIGLLLLFVGPILFLIFQQNKKEKDRLKKFQIISRENNVNPETTEHSQSLSLGLDSKNRKLLVVEPSKNNQVRVINLNEMTDMKLNSVENINSRGIINQVSLEIFGNNKNIKIDEIIFYDENDNENIDADSRLIMAKNWNDLIKKAL